MYHSPVLYNVRSDIIEDSGEVAYFVVLDSMGLWFLGRVNPKNMAKRKNTSWDKVANWYDEVLKDGDSYQQKVILPNLLRRMASVSGGKILDLGCGQGHFARAVRSSLGAKVTGVDLSNELIKIAKQKSPTEIKYHVASADKLPFDFFGRQASFSHVSILPLFCKGFSEVVHRKCEGLLRFVLT